MPSTAPIDTYVRVETAEAIDIFLRPANIFTRTRAYAMDLLLQIIFLWVSILGMLYVFIGSGLSNWLPGLIFLNLFVTLWLYPVLFEVFWHGQTPGKRLFNIQVISDNGAQIGWSASLLRNLLRLVDGLPYLYAVGMSAMLLHPQGKRIGDVLASTLVVYVDNASAQANWKALHTTTPLAPPLVLTHEEQQALVSFAERQHKLPLAHRQELAELLVQAIYGYLPTHEDALTLVLGMARHSIGEQPVTRSTP